MHNKAKSSLERWQTITKYATWKHFNDVRQTFSTADTVTVASGRTTVAFNIGGNHYRLITAIHYNLGKVFVLRVLTHAEYSTDQ